MRLYEKRHEYTRTRMVQLAPYLVADSVETYRTDSIDGDSIDVFVGADSATAWELLSAPETVTLAAIGLVAIAVLVRPVAALAVRVLGAVAVAIIVFRIVDPDIGFTATTGAFVALAGALVALAGAWLVRRDVA